MKKILIVGGGASGLMAAINAANSNTKVTIFEKNDRVGKKLLATGNGKCNLSNLNFSFDFYHSDNKELLPLYFNQFGVNETVSVFKELGLMIKEKNGYLYPFSEQASVVLDLLRYRADLLGIEIKTDISISKITKSDNIFKVIVDDNIYEFDSIILACGSKAGLSKKDIDNTLVDGYTLAKQLGHTVTKLFPSLVQVRCKEDFFKSIAGVRSECSITLYDEKNAIARENGELQLTDYGISGICVFQMSGLIAREKAKGKSLHVVIDFMPEYDEEEFELFLNARLMSYSGQSIEKFFLGLINKKLCMLFIKNALLKPDDIVCDKNLPKILEACLLLKQFVLEIDDVNPMFNAQVCCGGIRLSEVNEHLESKICKNLYFCGEILDVDGKCGGYNLQWAWTSGVIAGIYASKGV